MIPILIALASYRLWRLAAKDSISETSRRWLFRHSPHWVRELVECPWCLGSWIAFGMTWATDAVVGVQAPVLVGLGAAVVVGWLGEYL